MEEDANAILAIPIPQRDVADRVVWTGSKNGVYNVKSGYHYWFNLRYGTVSVPQSVGWKRVWHLKIPQKVKVFIWRFCRNIVPVRKRLSARGLRVPITCPMCLSDIEHMTHLFFDCDFAADCWRHVRLWYEWSAIENACDWLLAQISSTPIEEVTKICIVLWGVWFWRNKKVWESKVVTPAFAMDNSFKVLSEWMEAKKEQVMIRPNGNPEVHQVDHRWQCLGPGAFKINVDASVFPNAQFFSVGMVMRDHLGSFVACKVGSFPMVDTVFEAELVGVKEALSWIKGGQYSNAPVQLETDSLLSVKAILED